VAPGEGSHLFVVTAAQELVIVVGTVTVLFIVAVDVCSLDHLKLAVGSLLLLLTVLLLLVAVFFALLLSSAPLLLAAAAGLLFLLLRVMGRPQQKRERFD
jgi:phosphatidylserine synthase